MVDAFNAAIAFRNRSDSGTIFASSSLVLTPPAILKDPHVARKWRGRNGDTEYLITSALSDFDTVLLRGLNLTGAGSYRVRVSSADTSGLTGDVYDSDDDAVAGSVDPDFATLLHLLPERVDGFVRIDMTEPGASYIEAGRLCVAPRVQFSNNFSFDWAEKPIDRSTDDESRGGQTYIDPDVVFRSWLLTFANLSAAQRYDEIQDLDRLVGTKADFLMILNPQSDHLGRDSLWGRVKQIGANVQRQFYIDERAGFSKSFEMFERL